jgi:uncharacterized protein involved in propanediol utilization
MWGEINGYANNNLIASFVHLHFAHNSNWPKIVQACRQWLRLDDSNENICHHWTYARHLCELIQGWYADWAGRCVSCPIALYSR